MNSSLSFPVCSICLDSFTENEPGYLLSCAHTYHIDCLRMLKPAIQIICPTCKSITPGKLDDLKKNYSLMSLLEEIKNTEIKLKSTQCPEHNEPLKLFCYHCRLAICTFCRQYGGHTECYVQLISKAMKDYQKEVESMIQNEDLFMKKFGNYLIELNKDIESLNENSKHREKEIDTVMDNLIMVINKRRNSLKRELRKQTLEEVSILNHEKEVITQSSGEIHSHLVELKSILKNINGNISSMKDIDCSRIPDWTNTSEHLDHKKKDYLIPTSFDVNQMENMISLFGTIGPSKRNSNLYEARIREENEKIVEEQKIQEISRENDKIVKEQDENENKPIDESERIRESFLKKVKEMNERKREDFLKKLKELNEQKKEEFAKKLREEKSNDRIIEERQHKQRRINREDEQTNTQVIKYGNHFECKGCRFVVPFIYIGYMKHEWKKGGIYGCPNGCGYKLKFI